MVCFLFGIKVLTLKGKSEMQVRIGLPFLRNVGPKGLRFHGHAFLLNLPCLCLCNSAAKGKLRYFHYLIIVYHLLINHYCCNLVFNNTCRYLLHTLTQTNVHIRTHGGGTRIVQLVSKHC